LESNVGGEASNHLPNKDDELAGGFSHYPGEEKSVAANRGRLKRNVRNIIAVVRKFRRKRKGGAWRGGNESCAVAMGRKALSKRSCAVGRTKEPDPAQEAPY